MIATVPNIEFIISLYPNPLRTMHKMFRLDIEGATTPIILHSQVAFALMKISQGTPDSLRKYIEHYS